MTIAAWMVLLAALLPYLTVGVAKADRSYDNRDPRAWLARQSGFRQRAHAAHLNHFEAFAPFAVAVLLAQQAEAPQRPIDLAAIAFIALRASYTIAYLRDAHLLRSLLWLLGAGTVLAIFLMPVWAR